ncbi:hypothetical protein [Cesiribacter andamanensis]|uniref:Uncharacterized protein n=1 Tax=Cesiribacter andamanensis AMV16 TaxID=1279009 RepID=M7NC17_9BACT|nr:hypothetical protein [Cesiribacter andamanensis]EMR04762.1 hypothetical protein ADICEAN_00033 [Cesiribacter andamanensis AMV16]
MVGCLLATQQAYGQYEPAARQQRGQLPAFLFEDFLPASVLFKSGTTARIAFNYNCISEEMVFVREGKLLALDMPDVDTIFIQHRKFVPVDNAYFEVLTTPSGLVYVRHKTLVTKKGKPAGYGGYSETAAISTLNSYEFEENVVPLSVYAGAELKDASRFWIWQDHRLVEVSTPKLLQKVFPDHRQHIQHYAREHRLERFTQEKLLMLLAQLQ